MASRRDNTQRKRWVFTSFAMEPTDLEALFADDAIAVGICQRELCPQTNNPHYQGYIELSERKRFSQLVPMFPRGTHLEGAKGTKYENYIYCTKEATFVEGSRRQKGAFDKPRSVLREEKGNAVVTFMQDITSGTTNRELMERAPLLYMRYLKNIAQIRMDAVDTRRTRPIGVVLLTGTTGTGKSWAAAQYAEWHHEGKSYRLTPYDRNKPVWFDGYDGASLLIIEDFDGGMPFRRLLTILDHYHSNLEVKGAHAAPNWTEVIITSNTTPPEWYNETTLNIDPLVRRIGLTVTMEPGDRASEKWDWRVPIATNASHPFEQKVPVPLVEEVHVSDSEEEEVWDSSSSDEETLFVRSPVQAPRLASSQ